MTTQTPLQASPTALSHGMLALSLGALTFSLAIFCLMLIKLGGPVSPLWFPTALMTIVVFRLPLTSLPLILSACLVGLTGANAMMAGPSPEVVTFALLNLLQAAFGGALLRRLIDPLAPLDTLLSWVKIVASVGLLAPLLGGVVATLLINVSDRSNLHFFSTWVISEMIGMLVLGPVCLLWRSDYFHKNFSQHVLLETLLTLVATLLLSYLALRYLPWPFTFVIVVLFYSAVRLPRFEAFVVFLATLAMMSLMLTLHLLDLRSNSGWFTTRTPWLPFLMAIIPSHIMTLVMHSFREERKHIVESETRFRHAMEFSKIGMALLSPEGQWVQVNKSLCSLLGYQAHELLQLTFQQITHPEDVGADLAHARTLLQGEVESYSLEKRYYHRSGRIVWARLAVSLVRDSERQPLYFISQIEDITELKKTEAINRRLMQRITLANEAGGIGVWDWNLRTGRISWDKRMCEIYQLPEDAQPTYDTWADMLLPADRQMATDAFNLATLTPAPLDIHFRINTASGIRHIRSQSTMVLDEKGQLERMLGISQDMTTMRLLTDALYQEKERMHITLDSIGEAVISTDKAMRVTFMNPVAESMSGWTQENAAGKPIGDILRITRGHSGPAMEILLQGEPSCEITLPDIDRELVLHNAAGTQYEIHYTITPLKTQEGESIGSVLVIQDVSESREMMRRLSHSASHDMLTRLPNRVNFELQLQRLLQSARDNHQQHVLVFIDLDRFKSVNDSAGHAAGDALLRELAGVMRQRLCSSDMLARLGGDEFGVLLADVTLEEARERISRTVLAVNEYRFIWQGQRYPIGASAGITLINRHNCNDSEVMAQADLACYNAKHSGRGQFSVYGSALLKHLNPLLSRRENE